MPVYRRPEAKLHGEPLLGPGAHGLRQGGVPSSMALTIMSVICCRISSADFLDMVPLS